jgi:hypothetical protein
MKEREKRRENDTSMRLFYLLLMMMMIPDFIMFEIAQGLGIRKSETLNLEICVRL